jgi:beta-lactamase regulating signal transducer with metallopeptidase domain
MPAGAIDLVVRALILLAAAWLVVSALRRRSASIRALVWTSALAGVLLLPAVSRVTPSWQVAAWPAHASSPLQVTSAPLAAQEVPILRRTEGGVPAMSVVSSREFSLVSPPPAAADGERAISASRVVMVLWACIALLLLARTAASYVRMWRVASSARECADDDWTAIVDEIRVTLRIGRRVAVRTSDAVNVPAVIGVWRPALLLPADADEWAPDVRRAVVLHELAHVARWDVVGQLAGQVACASYWFVPLAWYGARRAASFRERASDDVVIRAGVRPSAYAESLIRLARAATGADLQPAALSMARPSRLRERVAAILDPAARRGGATARATATVLLLAASAVTVVAAVRPSDPAPAPVLTVNTGGLDAVATAPVEPAPIAAAPSAASEGRQRPAQDASRLCGGRGLDSSSSSVNDDGRVRRWTVKLSGGGCTVDLRAEGRIDFAADFTDITGLSTGGFFRLDVTENGSRHQLEIESRNGTLARTWRVDGREQPYDAAARAWFGAFLIELDRRTAIGVDIRLPLLLKQGGAGAVLKETALMPSDYARGEYYGRMVKSTWLTPEEVARVLEQATSMKTSDYYASELLGALAGQGLQHAAVRAAVLQLIDRIESDHYAAQSIEVLMGSGRPTTVEMDFLLRTVPRMKSDHYKTNILTKIVRGGRLDAGQQAALAKVASSITSDHYAAEFLKTIARAGSMDAALRAAFVGSLGHIKSDYYVMDVVAALFDSRTATAADVRAVLGRVPAIDSDHYSGEIIARLLSVSQLAEGDLIAVVQATKSIGSDHYKAEALRRIARHPGANDAVRKAVLDAGQGMSRHYADELRRAIGR